MNSIKTQLRGYQLLQNPLFNKGTAFTKKERDELGLNGLLPPHISTIDEQLYRCRLSFQRKKTPLGKYLFLLELLHRNELLFYQFVSKNPAEMLPFIYTPTVGEASTHYSMIFSQERGLYLSYPLKDQMEKIFEEFPMDDIEVIVATDGERILGLGDQGLGGMAISVGKLALYSTFAGIHPAKTLPVILDVGTNNQEHLENDLYLGWRHSRLTGQEYDEMIEEFVRVVKKRYPNALLQWEDFGKNNAPRVLEKYRKKTLSFNDDIQGTGAVTVAALLSAIQVIQSEISHQRFVIVGGGSAGTGIASMLIQAMEQEGLSGEDALRRVFLLDSKGLLHTGSIRASESQRPFLHPKEALEGWVLDESEKISLKDVVRNAKPTALVGVCGQSGIFDKELIQEMARHVDRPIILPLSNPTSKAECIPSQAIEWTHGKAILATGSPFAPVEYLGRSITIGQCNNVYIFPAIGLGSLAVKAKEITEAMFLTAARILANHAPALQEKDASLFPPLDQVRSVCREIARGVARQAIQDKVAQVTEQELEERIDQLMWDPVYPDVLAD